jgi:hypothetical protein
LRFHWEKTLRNGEEKKFYYLELVFYLAVSRKLILYPNGVKEDVAGYMSLYLHREDSLRVPFDIRVKLKILGTTKPVAELLFHESNKTFKKGGGKGNIRALSHANFEKYADQIIVDGCLKIGCEVRKMSVSPFVN